MSERFGMFPLPAAQPRSSEQESRLAELREQIEDAEFNREEMEKARDGYSLVIEQVRAWFPQLVENDYLVDPKFEPVREYLNQLASHADLMEELRGEFESRHLQLLQKKHQLTQN